jgi:hypothetical protein
MRVVLLSAQKVNHFAGLIALTICLTACAAASGPKFPQSRFATQPVATDKGRIIFYRESDANFGLVALGVDGSRVGALRHKGFVAADTAPGDHKMSAWAPGMPIWEFVIGMNIVAGETYYVRVAQRAERMLYPFWGIFGVALLFADTKGEFKLEAVPAAIALVDLEELSLSE